MNLDEARTCARFLYRNNTARQCLQTAVLPNTTSYYTVHIMWTV